MSDPTTVYDVADDRGVSWQSTDPERVERLSRAGFRVTALTTGESHD